MKHDLLFKSLLRAFFRDFLRLFWPNKAARIDFRHVRFLDQEVVTDLPRGSQRWLDLVAEVSDRTGRRKTVLIHVEIEARLRACFARRMFRYYMALRMRYNREVFPIALVLSGTGRGVERAGCSDEALGDQVCAFRFWRILLPALAGAAYVSAPNPLAPAFAALMKPGGRARAQWHLECLRGIARARVNEARRSLLVHCVESYLPLKAREATKLGRELRKAENEEVLAMRKLWFERLVDKRVKREEKVIEKRIEKRAEKSGEKRGEKRGALRAKREALLTILKAKFGSLPACTTRAVSELANPRRLNNLLRRTVTADSLENLGLR
ncbi:MAG: hypothetical protein HYZ53_11325 [Planctomycetes bacterium]|nr:hypothetical protein [Planctomycetota bacterium]